MGAPPTQSSPVHDELRDTRGKRKGSNQQSGRRMSVPNLAGRLPCGGADEWAGRWGFMGQLGAQGAALATGEAHQRLPS